MQFKSKKILISVGENDYAQSCSYNSYLQLKEKKLDVAYLEFKDFACPEFLDATHSPYVLLTNSPEASLARSWLQNLFSN
jgi:hypothetical protein